MSSIKEFTPKGKTFEQAVSREQEPVEPQLELEVKPAPEVKPVDPPKPDDEFDLDAKVGLKAAEKKAEEQPKPPKRVDAIREQLNKVVEERDAERKKTSDAEAERERIRKEHDDFKKSAEERLKELDQIKASAAVGDPSTHPEVRKIADPWNSSAREFSSDMADLTGSDPDKIFSMVLTASKRIADMEPSGDEYKKTMAEIRSELSNELGDGGLLQGMKMVRDGAGAIRQIKGIVSEIKGDLPKFQFRQEVAFYSKAKADYDQIEANLFNPSDATKTADPMNHSVILRAMIDGSEEVKKAAEATKAFTRFAILPPPPIPPEELEGMSETARTQKVTELRNRHAKANNKLREVMAEALLARQLLPSLFQRISDLEDAIGGERKALRAQAKSGEAPQRAEKSVGIEKFEPSNDELEEFRKRP